MGVAIGVILFIGMMALLNGIIHLSGEIGQLGWRNPQTQKSLRVTLMGAAVIGIGLVGVWLNGHVH